jgi:hypothetical protein
MEPIRCSGVRSRRQNWCGRCKSGTSAGKHHSVTTVEQWNSSLLMVLVWNCSVGGLVHGVAQPSQLHQPPNDFVCLRISLLSFNYLGWILYYITSWQQSTLWLQHSTLFMNSQISDFWFCCFWNSVWLYFTDWSQTPGLKWLSCSSILSSWD